MKNYRDFIPLLGAKADPVPYGVYPFSINKVDSSYVFMAKEGKKDLLVIVGPDLGFTGEKSEISGTEYTVAQLVHENANVLRKQFSFTAPVPVLSKERTLGVGDRLGIATFGHIRVFQEFDLFPVLAQQSIRELNLTQRTYKDVLDSVSFAVYREGYKKGFGADGDHLKKSEEVKMALDLGFTMITLDCSEHMHNEAESLPLSDVQTKYPLANELKERYLNQKFDIAEGIPQSHDDPIPFPDLSARGELKIKIRTNNNSKTPRAVWRSLENGDRPVGVALANGRMELSLPAAYIKDYGFIEVSF